MLWIRYTLLQAALCLAWMGYGQIKHAEDRGNLSDEAVRERRKIDDSIKSFYLKRESDPDKAIAKLEEIGEESRQAGYPYGFAKAGLAIANIIINLKPEEDFNRALAIQQKIRNIILNDPQAEPRFVELWYQQMGTCFSSILELDSAMFYYHKALSIGLNKKNRTPADIATLAINYVNLEDLFLEMGQPEKAIYYAMQSAPLAAGNGLKEQLFQSYAILATAYIKLKNADSASRYVTLMKAVDYKHPDLERKIHYETLGAYHLLKKEPAAAVAHFRKAVAINKYLTPSGYQGMGIAYKLLGNYRLAEENLLQAEKQLLSQKNSNVMLAETYAGLAEVYDSLRDYKMAYHYRSREGIIQKEIDNALKVKMINGLEGAFRKAEQDKQLAQNEVQLLKANARLSGQRAWIAGISVIALLLLTLSALLYQKQKLQRQRSRTVLQHQEIEKLKAAIEAEEKERSRIGRELHDDIMVQLSLVKMNLEALPAQLPEIKKINDFASATEQLRIAGRDLRQTAHNLSPDTLLADGLTQALLYFFKNVQYRTKLNVNFQHYGHNPGLPQETEINIYRIVQELVQNIIKHAQAKNVLIQLSYREDVLTLTIEDDGVGFDAAARSGKEGIGLKGIRSRLKVINGTMDIHTRHPQGTSITIEIYV
jgi:signal transduction histidine kinase